MRTFFLFCCLLMGIELFAQKQVMFDSSKISARSFSQQELQEFRNDSDFQYERVQPATPNLWKRFWKWIWWKISEIMSTRTGRGSVYVMVTAVAVIVLFYFIMQVMGMSKNSLLARNTTSNQTFSAYPEDIHQISFDDAIREAVAVKNYRLAIRLSYLKTLKHLSDDGLIEWQLNKSNAEFLQDATGQPWQSMFRKLTYSFEYAWYGEMKIGMEEFEILNAQFQQFNSQLQ